MAIHAYNENYLSNASTTLATMLDYAVNIKKENIDQFFVEFITSGIAGEFGVGNPMYIVGKTGIDLYYEVKQIDPVYDINSINSYYSINRSPEFWVGYYLAFAQWYLNVSFATIVYAVPVSEMLSWYPLAHEADVINFAEKIEKRILQSNNNLRIIRERNGLSQNQLSNLSGVGIRNIQMYEQGKNDIGKAQYNTLTSLARPLNCSQNDLVQSIDFKQQLINQLEKEKAQLEQNLCSNRPCNQYNREQAVSGYINQFPYNNLAYYNGNYYANKNEVTNNFTNYWNGRCFYGNNREQMLNSMEQIAKGIAISTNNKDWHIVADSIGIVNSKNIFEAIYHILNICDNVNK